MANLLAELGTRYDVVLVDAPPLVPVTDAAALGTGCDGALLVVRHGRATRNQVATAVAALDAVSVRLLGTVLTMAPTSGRNQYYYYSPGKGDARHDQPAPVSERYSPAYTTGPAAVPNYVDAQRVAGPTTGWIPAGEPGSRTETHDVLAQGRPNRHG